MSARAVDLEQYGQLRKQGGWELNTLYSPRFDEEGFEVNMPTTNNQLEKTSMRFIRHKI